MQQPGDPRRQRAAGRPAPGPGASALLQRFRSPQYFLPALIVAGMLGVAFGLQPGGGGTTGASANDGGLFSQTSTATQPPTSPTGQPTQAKASPSPTPKPTDVAQGDNRQGANPPGNGTAAPGTTPTEEVAGARSTPSATPEPDLSRESTQCGTMQETTVPLSVEQTLNGVSVRVSRATVYPVDYFRCILLAAGNREGISLSTSISRAQREGATHAVLVDLWVTNAAKDFGQVNLKKAQLAAAGRVFSPLATLGGRSEVVISSGQGRNVTLVVTLTNELGDGTGPMTLTIEAPLIGGKATAGKYQLFLPTP